MFMKKLGIKMCITNSQNSELNRNFEAILRIKK